MKLKLLFTERVKRSRKQEILMVRNEVYTACLLFAPLSLTTATSVVGLSKTEVVLNHQGAPGSYAKKKKNSS